MRVHKPSYQTVARSDGTVFYKKQVTHPVTGKRVTFTASSVAKLMAQCSKVLDLRRDLRHALVTVEDAERAMVEAREGTQSVSLVECWRRYVDSSNKASRWAKKLQGMWKLHLAPRWASAPVHQLTAAACAEWCEDRLAARLAPKTVENMWQALVACVRLAVAMGRVAKVPWGGFTFRASKEARRQTVGKSRAALTTEDEAARMFGAATDMAREAYESRGTLPDLGHRWVVMSHLAMRRGEAMALTWDKVRALPSGDTIVRIDVQLQEGWRAEVPRAQWATFRPAAPPKGGSGSIQFGADHVVTRALRAQRALLERWGWYRDDGPVFPDDKGRFRARNLVAPEVVRRMAARAGLASRGHWVQHSARHSGVTLEIRGGAAPAQAQAVARHRDLATTQGYYHKEGLGAPRLVADAGTALGPNGMPALDTSAELRPAFDVREAVEVTRGHHERSLGRRVQRDFPTPTIEQATERATDAGLAFGGAGYPSQVRAVAAGAYRRAYNAERRICEAMRVEKEEAGKRCRAAGARARRAMLAAWAAKAGGVLRAAAGEPMRAARLHAGKTAKVGASTEPVKGTEPRLVTGGR